MECMAYEPDVYNAAMGVFWSASLMFVFTDSFWHVLVNFSLALTCMYGPFYACSLSLEPLVVAAYIGHLYYVFSKHTHKQTLQVECVETEGLEAGCFQSSDYSCRSLKESAQMHVRFAANRRYSSAALQVVDFAI
ncbi:hypothetical protein THASP1DRAFT_29874 [Thamnocephalis sphaerospora]|uniref:Uncharacterized protein n=1 Tax=Thamnocephalis sphaerospora TaxID=78915 RepID=A0A4P9XS20_9FUNG|nr:hypothetical protein THASP1DRAFT_29874 [Thamnocephalis sphaerospora]|eukprot:RKP08321.1 hypothetical protein THASP1DRAFT_29874 [Thamnocephalis sphaerospora]